MIIIDKNYLKHNSTIKNKKRFLLDTKVKLLFIMIFLLNIKLDKLNKKKKKLKIGVVGVRHEINVGNNLLKYALSILLKEMGFIPYIIGTRLKKYNISFINKTTNLIIINNNFTEIKKNDYDILMVNSDQTWRKFDQHFLDYGFLKFAENWNITKFVYGASLGFNYWNISNKDEINAKQLLKSFKGISVREQGSINLIKNHFGIIPEIVLDPTLLIDKKYYLDLIKNHKKINITNYIFVYKLNTFPEIINFISKSSNELNYTIYEYILYENNIEDFIYYLSNSKAVITNSFHGTIFSIIFNKPFVTFNLKDLPIERLNSLGNLLGVSNRIFANITIPDIKLLTTPLKVNNKLIKRLKNKSINFIKKNLEVN